jgi:hypothetical protein
LGGKTPYKKAKSRAFRTDERFDFLLSNRKKPQA